MKKSYILITLAIIAALSMVSCKNNNKKTQSKNPSQEEVQEMKQALADSVLAEIDAFADQYSDAASKAFRLQAMELTDDEKQVKPDYLLDPSLVSKFITKSQKYNALVIYIIEDGIRKIYDMPRNDGQEAIAKLVADLNYPFDAEFAVNNNPVSEKIKARYNAFKERGELASFWGFEVAFYRRNRLCDGS